MRCPRCGGLCYLDRDPGWAGQTPWVCWQCAWSSQTLPGPPPKVVADGMDNRTRRSPECYRHNAQDPPKRNRSGTKPKPRTPLLRQVADAIDALDPAEWAGRPTSEVADHLAQQGIRTTDKGIGWALNRHSAIWRTDKSNPHRRRNNIGRWVNQAVLKLRADDF